MDYPCIDCDEDYCSGCVAQEKYFQEKRKLQKEVEKAKWDKVKIITLCGSTKFKDEFIEINKKLTLEGNLVISVGLFGHSGDFITEDQKYMLDELHKRKIDLADAIFVINKNGYIGNSTKNEIEYAKENNKEILYLEEVKNGL